MRYDWVPMPKRKPLKWPNGKRLALILTMNCEYWDMIKDSSEPYYAGGPPMNPDPVPGNIADFPNFTWREYGLRVGVWRMGTLKTINVPLAELPPAPQLVLEAGRPQRSPVSSQERFGLKLLITIQGIH